MLTKDVKTFKNEGLQIVNQLFKPVFQFDSKYNFVFGDKKIKFTS